MNPQSFRIFYSWQSDLPGNETRYLIQESIESVTNCLQGVAEVDADRDTKGELGSPDIAQTIFAKIDDCDLFVADVSVVNKYSSITVDKESTKEVKLAPNPNVLLELGYAASSLGWDRVICVINTDFGDINDLPFDIRNRRLTPYSFSKDGKKGVQKKLCGIIADTVKNLIESGPSKKGDGKFADFAVGSYDFTKGEVARSQLCPYKVKDLPGYHKKRVELVSKCKELMDEIMSFPPLEKNHDAKSLASSDFSFVRKSYVTTRLLQKKKRGKG